MSGPPEGLGLPLWSSPSVSGDLRTPLGAEILNETLGGEEDPPWRFVGKPTERPSGRSRERPHGPPDAYQCTPLNTLASMICSDSRVPLEPSPLAAAESGNTW
jgi:hypothetical protein